MNNLWSIALCAILLAGCGSIGGADYGCPGKPQGVMCKSAAEVYAMTGGAHATIAGGSSDAAAPDQPNGGLPGRLLEPLAIPMPIMEPAQVQRIWIAPWQDASGDLNWPSHVFTEVTPRRWHVGEKTAVSAPIIVPIEILPPQAKGEDDQNQANQSATHSPSTNPAPAKGMP